MTSISEKYKTLAPRLEYLRDIVVLAQAWKKSHNYIRRHNWYADTLELDASSINLQDKLSLWASQLQGNYVPNPARLVPAPKNLPWSFEETNEDGWGPSANMDELVLRPLAHIGIREQTIATTAMLCLADCIESAQGDTSTNVEDALKHEVFSYGNRLHCNWHRDTGRARFSWGNSDLYSGYFQDYQTFVKRPLQAAQRATSSQRNIGRVYVVQLDINAFYDNIDLARLIVCLRREYSRFRQLDSSLLTATAQFWDVLQKTLSIPWDASDRGLSPLLKGGVLPGGLPQGLVAGGFFANAYLLQFDRAVGRKTRDDFVEMGDHQIQVHDYCRYVDDLRLVVSCDDDQVSDAELAGAVSGWIQDKLEKHANHGASTRLVVNPQKTEIEPYASIGGDTGTAARMKSLQRQLSGPFDVAALQHVEGGLNGLLALAELGAARIDMSTERTSIPALASVARPKLEVRDDTLTRFSAYRLTKALRMRRSMTDLSQRGDSVSAKELLSHDFEVAARRLVAAWASNPSLVQVLLYGLDLFPSPELLGTVTDALLVKIRRPTKRREQQYQRRVALYIASELLRAGATYTGQRAEMDPTFKAGDVSGYRKRLGAFAEILLQQEQLPWYVAQQASLLLAVGKKAFAHIPSSTSLQFHLFLHSFLGENIPAPDLPLGDAVSTSLVGHQISGNHRHYAKWLRRFVTKLTSDEKKRTMEIIGETDAPLLQYLLKHKVGRPENGRELGKLYLSHPRYNDSMDSDSVPLPSGSWISLNDVITHPSRAFHQENALLQLAYALSTLLENESIKSEQITPLTVEVNCSSWEDLADPRQHKLNARVNLAEAVYDPRYRTPEWCTVESASLYAVGRLLRAAATGEVDFTIGQWLLREADNNLYAGFRSTWQKRRLGLLNTGAALGGTTGAITPWFTELLMNLLRWPGIYIREDARSVQFELTSASELRSLLKKRLAHQAELYGTSSRLPVYVYPVDWPVLTERRLRVGLIQGLMPLAAHFAPDLKSLENAAFRERHRNHTAQLLYLAYQQILARDAVLGEVDKPLVDLVLLPEYSVHVEDQDLIRAFSDATGAMVFYGLCGLKDPTTGRPVNAARWLVPQRRAGHRSWIEIDQGKKHPTAEEVDLGVQSWRPYQVIIELRMAHDAIFRLSGTICYDATDISLAADLKNLSHMFAVVAMNRDVKTFDNMVVALRYHMYQHVLVANSGEFGGSTAQAPYDKEHERLIAHSHGANQISINVFDVDIEHFGPRLRAAKTEVDDTGKKKRIGKTPPAALIR